MVASEHGDVGNDEVNILRRGANCGWPRVMGADHGRFEAPVALYRPAIAPSGATFVSLPGSEWSGDFLIGALVGEQIRHLRFGRIRTVVEGPDGALYALTATPRAPSPVRATTGSSGSSLRRASTRIAPRER
jgi:glucose/arabinose dehydrogenase